MPGNIRVRMGEVDQTLHVSDLGVTLAFPHVGLAAMHYPLRLFSPGPELLNHRLGEAISRASKGDPREHRGLGLLLLSTVLTPRRVITDRYIRARDLEAIGLGPKFGPLVDLKKNFARALQAKIRGASKDPDLDAEVVSVVLHAKVKEDPLVVAAAKALEPGVLEALLARKDILVPGHTSERARAEATSCRNAVKVFIERRVPDLNVRQVLALRALGAVDAFVSDVNEEILEKLPADVTPVERRTFSLLFLKQEAPIRPGSQRYFSGVLTSNRFLWSLLRWAPSDVQDHLKLTYLHRAWREDHVEAAGLTARRNLSGLLRLGSDLVAMIRSDDRDTKSEKRPPPPGWTAHSFMEADQAETTDLNDRLRTVDGDEEQAAHLLAAEDAHFAAIELAGRRLTAKQDQALQLAMNMNKTEIARELGISRQSVANRLEGARSKLTGTRRR